MTTVPAVDLADDSFVVAAPSVVAARLRDREFWKRCWPGLTLTSYHDRGAEGERWYVGGELVGTAELWLEPYHDGTLVHVYLRADPLRPMSARRVNRLRRRYAIALKAALFEVKDLLEQGRTPGASRTVRPSPSKTVDETSLASTEGSEDEPDEQPEPDAAT
ncbi:MAG TPA: polyketide cyclase / dehydrase and lipid transport [Actinopolymorphaceae bacterium]|jgi:hypothetical protein